MIDEDNERLKGIWEMFTDYEIGHLQIAAELFKKYEKRDPEEVIGNKIVLPCRFKSQKDYVTKILVNEIDKRLDSQGGYIKISDLPADWASYDVQEKVGKDGAPSEAVIQIMSALKGRDLLIADDKLKSKEHELLQKGLEPIAQSPDTVSVEHMKNFANADEIEHECD